MNGENDDDASMELGGGVILSPVVVALALALIEFAEEEHGA